MLDFYLKAALFVSMGTNQEQAKWDKVRLALKILGMEELKEHPNNETTVKCPEHKIYISPSTFEYQSELDNLLWKDKTKLTAGNETVPSERSNSKKYETVGNKDAFYKVAQAISETLPIESKEKKLLDGFLLGKKKLLSEIKDITLQRRLFRMREPLKEILKRIVEEADPDKIILFGSRTKAKSTKWSDYDICVLKSDKVKRNELEKRIYLKLFGIGVPVDVIVETIERFEELKENKFLIYYEIAKHGRTIYEK